MDEQPPIWRNPRLRAALLLYAVLGALAAITLDDERIRLATLILLAGLAFKTWLAHIPR